MNEVNKNPVGTVPDPVRQSDPVPCKSRWAGHPDAGGQPMLDTMGIVTRRRGNRAPTDPIAGRDNRPGSCHDACG